MTEWDNDPIAIPEFLRRKDPPNPLAPNRRRGWTGFSVAIAAVAVAAGCGLYLEKNKFSFSTGPSSSPASPGAALSPSFTTTANAASRDVASAPAPKAPAAAPSPAASLPTTVRLANAVAPAAVAANPTLAQAAQLAPAAKQPASVIVHGLDDNEIRFGMASPFSGANRESGTQLKIGVETAFGQANDAGGVNGRKLRLIADDDGYEPARTVGVVRDLYEKKDVLGFLCDFGTATAGAALPYVLENKALFFGALSGAGVLRRDPPDRYVFNFRPSYSEETAAAVRYLTRVRRISPKDIAVFAQDDGFGDAGYEGVAKMMRQLPDAPDRTMKLTYKRNTIDVNDAAKALMNPRNHIKAVVMVATFRAAAKFVEKTRDALPEMIYTNVSAVGSTSLADELKLLGPRYSDGVVVTQVTPSVSSSASSVLKYKDALNKYFPGQEPDYTSFEAYIDTTILIEALKRAGRDVNVEKIVDTLESFRDLDLGLGTQMRFSDNDHQASHKVWGTMLSADGVYKPIDLQ